MIPTSENAPNIISHSSAIRCKNSLSTKSFSLRAFKITLHILVKIVASYPFAITPPRPGLVNLIGFSYTMANSL